jgi:hypothetical protein
MVERDLAAAAGVGADADPERPDDRRDRDVGGHREGDAGDGLLRVADGRHSACQKVAEAEWPFAADFLDTVWVRSAGSALHSKPGWLNAKRITPWPLLAAAGYWPGHCCEDCVGSALDVWAGRGLYDRPRGRRHVRGTLISKNRPPLSSDRVIRSRFNRNELLRRARHCQHEASNKNQYRSRHCRPRKRSIDRIRRPASHCYPESPGRTRQPECFRKRLRAKFECG